MPPSSLNDAQNDELEKRIASIGHNQGPALVARADEILESAATHHRLKAELTGIRVMLDMLRSHLSGERLMPFRTTGYVVVGLSLVCLLTGLSIAAEPLGVGLVDAVVLAAILAALDGEIGDYATWRAARDPSYEAIKQALAGKRPTT